LGSSHCAATQGGPQRTPAGGLARVIYVGRGWPWGQGGQGGAQGSAHRAESRERGERGAYPASPQQPPPTPKLNRRKHVIMGETVRAQAANLTLFLRSQVNTTGPGAQGACIGPQWRAYILEVQANLSWGDLLLLRSPVDQPASGSARDRHQCLMHHKNFNRSRVPPGVKLSSSYLTIGA
jgi:hypothetical protein